MRTSTVYGAKGDGASVDKAAGALALLMQRELGMSLRAVSAQWEFGDTGHHVLAVRMEGSLVPARRGDAGGGVALTLLRDAYVSLYEVYYDIYQEQIQALVSRLTGESVVRSALAVDEAGTRLVARFVLRPH